MASDAPEETEAKRSAPQADAMIDTSETSRENQKVELDLEDAPFLEDEEEVKPEPEPSVEVAPEEPEEEKKSPGRKKIVIIALAALLVLIAAVLAWKFLFTGKTAKPPNSKKNAAPPAAAAPAPQEYQIHLAPFWVEQKYGDDIRFLIVKMMLTTHDAGIAQEFKAKRLSARNAIFYYLKNKDVQFLADENNADKLKRELLLVINQYVTDGKFDSVLFEEYVVK